MGILQGIEAEQRARRKKVFGDYERQMKCERAKLTRAKGIYERAQSAFREAERVASAAHYEALKEIDVWGQDARRAAYGVTRPRSLSQVAATIRSTKLHGAKVSMPRLACLETAP